MSNDYHEVKGQPWQPPHGKRRVRDYAWVRTPDDVIRQSRQGSGVDVLIGVQPGGQRDGLQAGLPAAKAVELACAIIRVAEPETAAFLADCIEGHMVDYPDLDADYREAIKLAQRLMKLLTQT